jgi:hypothetical protein
MAVTVKKSKYYIKYIANGREKEIHFTSIPKDVYYTEGYQGPKGLAYITKWTDEGTALIPLIITSTKKQLIKRSKK